MKIRQICAAAMAFVLLLPSVGCGKGQMRKDLDAMTAAHEMGVGINLGNTFEAFWADENDHTAGASTIGENTPQNYETCWGAVVTTDECIDGIAAAGFSTLRVPVYWGNMMADDGAYQISADYIARVQEVVDKALADGLYVVINIHHYDEFLIKHHPQDEVLAAVGTVWNQIAEQFRNYPDHLVFEGFNEALGTPQDGTELTEDETYDYVNRMNQTFVDTVRATGGNNAARILIASGYWTNIDLTTDEKFCMPEDTVPDKLMVSVHYIDNSFYWMNQIGGERWEQYSTDQCNLLKARFTDNGIPVFVGECTSIYEDSHFIQNPRTEGSSACLQYILDMAADYTFVPVLWDVNDNFYSRTDCRISSDSDQAVITEVAARIAQKE